MNETDFNSLSEILGSSFCSDNKFSNTRRKKFDDSFYEKLLSEITKKVTLFSFWGDVVGEKFKNSSKPYNLKQGKLYVTCNSSYVLQDLSLYKIKLLKKIAPYAEGLNIKINDIVFNSKNWNHKEEIFEDYIDEEIDISNVELENSEIEKINGMVLNLSFLDEKQKEKLKTDIQNNLKAKKVRNN